MVIATPGRVAAALRAGHLTSATLAASLQMLILDEADLLLSYGYEDDLQLLAPMVPRSCQCVLMSATSSEDVERLQKLVLHSPTVLNLLDLGAALAAGSGTAHEILHFQLQVGPQAAGGTALPHACGSVLQMHRCTNMHAVLSTLLFQRHQPLLCRQHTCLPCAYRVYTHTHSRAHQELLHLRSRCSQLIHS